MRFAVRFLGTAAALVAAAVAVAQDSARVRIVPQTSDERIEDIQQSKDGSRLITHDRGYAPRLWDGRSMRLLRMLTGQQGTVQQVCFSPDGKLLLTVTESSAWIWDAVRAKPLAQVGAPPGSPFTVGAFRGDSGLIALGGETGEVRFFEPAGTGLMAAAGSHKLAVRHLEFSPDGQQVASSSADGTAMLWSPTTGAPLATLGGAEQAVGWSHFSGDGSLLACTSYDGWVRVFDTRSYQKVGQYQHVVGDKAFAVRSLMSALFVGENLNELLVADDKGTMHVIEPRSGRELRSLVGHTDSLREIRRTLDGRRVATYANDEQLLVWDTTSGKQLPFQRRLIDETYGETAGEFSPDGDAFWVGYTDGSIRRHDLTDGSIRQETLGALAPTTYGRLLGDNTSLFLKHGGGHTFLNLDAPNSPKKMVISTVNTSTSPDGRRVFMVLTPNYTPTAALVDSATGKILAGFQKSEGAAFSPQSDRFALWFDDTIEVYRSEDGEHESSWTIANSDVDSAVFSPDGKLLLTTGHKNNSAVLWDPSEGKIIREFTPGLPDDYVGAFFPNGNRVVFGGEGAIVCMDVSDGREVFRVPLGTAWSTSLVGVSPDASLVAVSTSFQFVVLDAVTGKQLWHRDQSVINEVNAEAISADWSTVVVSDYNRLSLRDMRSGEVLGTGELAAEVWDANLTPDGKRILSVEGADGLVVWDTKPVDGKLRRLGSMVIMADGTWLALDNDGRFDAPDPANVQGASFVLEWDGGLEAVAVPQLKELFYEPGLFKKLLGLSTEPVRPVPNLNALRLYPEMSVKVNEKNPLAVDVQLKQRDRGGFGTVTFWLNGKKVSSRRGTGVFTFDAQAYSQYLLPETHLPKGQGNLLQVMATNDAGDLSSPPTTIDLGVPAGLRAPDVRLFALCVGVSDYPGTAGDLIAPKTDAQVLAQAVRQVGERLLPGRVNVKTLTTDGLSANDQPTREAIVRWFRDVAKQSTSTDIVMVFFAGHGLGRVGERRGYFFLTPEADPASLTEASLSTSTISGDDLRDLLGKIPANKQVVILDTCHSGAATESLFASERSVSGDYQRAWEAIKDATGTWLLAGSAADQLSYESTNVEHGMLTYSLLEAIDRASSEGLRQGAGDELFVDVERWLSYAANRVESLKNEVGLKGVQRPEFKRSASGGTFDIGVTTSARRGSLGLKPPLPIVIVGEFEEEKEDPAGLEEAMRQAMRDSTKVKAWFDVSKHPNVFRIAGSYTTEGETVKVKVYVQQFDAKQSRKTVETFEVSGARDKAKALAEAIRSEVEKRIAT